MKWQTRKGVLGLLLSVTAALFACAFIGAVAFAGSDDLVSWEPQRQVENGERAAELTVSLGSGKWALVDIPLSSGVSVEYGGNLLDSTPLEDVSLPEGSAALLVENKDGTQVLRVVISEDSVAEPAFELTFSSEMEAKIPATGGEALAKTFENDEDLQTAIHSLLSEEDGATSASLTSFTVYPTVPEELTIASDKESVELGTSDANATFTIGIQKQESPNEGATAQSYVLSLSLPKGLSLPDGELSYSDGTIKCGTTQIARLTLPTSDGSPSVTSGSVTKTDEGLKLSLSVPFVEEEPVDPEYYEVGASINLSSLLRVPEAINGTMILSIAPSDSEGKSVSSEVTVTATAASNPGDDGWEIEPVEMANPTKKVFWNDNNDSDESRPTWSWDGGDNTLAPRLFFTIDGVRRELTADNLKLVGLSEMPRLSESNGTLTISGLPTKIQETSDETPGKEYSVSWTLEPPASVPSAYTLLDLSDGEVGEGTNYPSVTESGWYFMLHDTFVLKVDARQGLAEDLTDVQVKGLLGNFRFEWRYGADNTDHNNILTMLENESIGATFDKDTRTVTITGLWAYNVDGSPISYKVVEEPEGEGEKADGKLTHGELESAGIPTTIVPKDDYYAIQYDNAGLPNYGDKTDGVYNGGTLRLVRQGETTYEAFKMWLDSYPQNPEDETSRPKPSFTLYRYRRDQGVDTASIVSGVTVTIGSYIEDKGLWEIVAKDSSGNKASLEQYDAMNGYEWIYVVKETLGDSNYQQVFGRVAVSNDEDVPRGEVIPGTDVGPDKDWSRSKDDVYLYNEGTLTNQLKDSVTVPATKTWNAASFQNTFNESAVELKLQYRKAGSEDSWEDYTHQDESGETKTLVRYLHNFSSMFLTNSLTEVPAMPKYLVTEGGTTQEVEYRWLEVAVYESAPNATETSLGDNATGKYKVDYTDSQAGDGEGQFRVGNESRIYLVNTVAANNATTITNTLQDTLNYEVVKKWQNNAAPTEITISLYQAVTGTDFDYNNPYLTFTMSPDGNDGYKVTKQNVNTWPDNVDLWSSIDDWTDPDEESAYWPAVVENLPKYNEQGQAYEYLLLENGRTPQYKTEILSNGDYRTTVINGVGEGGFSFMVRKIWLDDSDVQHREPVTFTVYNRNTGEPIKINNGNSAPSDYTLTIGNDGVWHQVFWTTTNNWTDDSKNDVNGAEDIYVVETTVGGKPVNNGNDLTYSALYGSQSSDNIFDVTTGNHRYQVTYKYSSNDDNSGVPGTFTVTNRRLGNIDITATKEWVDGRLTLGDSPVTNETLSQTIANKVQQIKEEGGKNLALVFELEFDQEAPKDWKIENSGHLDEEDTVCVGGEAAPIYKNYKDGSTDQTGDAWKTYGEKGSSQQVIIGLNSDYKAVVSDSAHFFGLPKYDSEGNPVKYKVSEKWVELTEDNGVTTTEEVKLSELSSSEGISDDLKQLYTELENLWSSYHSSVESRYEENHAGAAHVRDFQTIKITNTRTDIKPVTWTKKWEDNFTSNSGLRPDLYLDIYAVVHEHNNNDGGSPYIRQIRKVTSTGDWETSEDGSQSITLSLPQFDDCGIEITYYAVERTVMSSIDYDYAVGKYSIGGTDLGTRDTPSEGANVLSTASSSGNEDEIYYVLDLNADNQDKPDPIDWEDSGDKPNDFGKYDSPDGNNYPRYALIEGGTFTNSLENTYSINGVKYWSNLPSGWEDARLPTVTFSVYRSTDQDNINTSGSPVATLEVSSEMWSQIRQGNRYSYLIEYTGVNRLRVKNGVITCDGEEDETELPRYSPEGDLYYYAVEETVDFTDTDAANGRVFKKVGNGFTFTNTYDPDKGVIKVKKFLYLPMTTDDDGNRVPEAYPAITFELTRQVKGASGNYEDDKAFAKVTHTISSEGVQKAWENSELGSEGRTNGYVTLNFSFEDLPLYAPDGSKYLYTVEEVKTQLNGYDTWVMKDDVNDPADVYESGEQVNELEPASTDTVAATFKNQQPEEPAYFEGFSGTKKWDDFNDVFNFRPTKDEYEQLLVLERSAASQTGQSNAMGPDKVLFEITWTEGSDSDTWDFTVKPVGGEAFEMYAPNGMPWKYTLSEPLLNGKLQLNDDADSDSNKVYIPSTSEGAWPSTIVASSQSQQQKTDFGMLTNSTSGKAWFEKKWVDANGNEITDDYLGFKLSVTFMLQVSTNDGATWNDAKDSKYVVDAVGQGYEFSQTISGSITTDWKGSFDNLPTIAKDNSNNNVYLTYRVVETSVQYGSAEQTVSLADTSDADGAYTVDPNGLVTSATFSKSNNTSTTTNKLDTTSVSVTKVWDDNNNQYGTRPGASGPWTWSAWFVLQRTTDDPKSESATWENVALFKELYGDNSESSANAAGNWSETISGLPTMDYSDQDPKPYAYRVRELQPPTDNTDYTLEMVNDEVIVDGDTLFNSAESEYSTTYENPDNGTWTVTNSLDLYTPGPDSSSTSLKAVKAWAGADENGDVDEVTFQLQYREKDPVGEWTLATFAVKEKAANNANDWTVTWEDLPSTLGGNDVEYRIVEKTVDGWVQLAEPAEASGDGAYTYTFTNSVTRDYTVEKKWNSGAETPSENVSVTVGLFRTTESSKVGSASGEKVPQSETDENSLQRTTQLNLGNSWTATFENLPKYDANGNTYYYYALELRSNGEPVSQPGSVEIADEIYNVTYDFDKPQNGLFSGLLDLFTGNDPYEKTTITNTLTTELTGTKNWLDNSNAYETRPDNVGLTLQRTTVSNPADSDWKDVDLDAEGIKLIWSGKNDDDNSWTFTYTNLPTVDASGARYTYRVIEEVPGGYMASYNGNAITNTLTGTVTINGAKAWVGGKAGAAPQLTLERRTQDDPWVVVSGVEPDWNNEYTTFTYSGLAKYNENGVLYEYRVRETVPGGYEVSYASGVAVDATTNAGTNKDGTTLVDGASITNYKNGELEVKKVVSGNRGEYARGFTFTVALTGASSAGTPASGFADKTFSYTITNSDGTQVSTGSLTFTSDTASTRVVSNVFNLSHGQTIKIDGLPAGIGYEVVELEAGKEGYSTTSVGAEGNVPAGSTVKAEYRNYRHVDDTVSVSGTKTWVDDGNVLGLRPEGIELRLYCSVSGGEEWLVEGVSPVWNKRGDVWSYTFVGLPKYDSSHNEYVYRVEEVVPDGYVGTSQGNDLTNTVIEHTDLTGTKTWVGDDPANRPDSITVVLYANGVEVATATASADSGWTYAFENMPRYDADGNEIVYTVVETPVPDGYVATYDGLNVTNTSSETVGSLRVTKLVRGAEAETNRDFTFTVTLGDPSINGTYGDMTFVNGVATFTLRHGQSAVAVGLPAGLSYVVSEAPAEGYALSATGQQGEIPVDSEATATFINTKGEDPEDPLDPTDPGDPGDPGKPVDPGEPGGGIPFSGDVVLPVALVALVGLVALVAAYRLRRRTR